MKKIAAAIALAITLTGATATAAFAKNGADDATSGRIDCRNGDLVCVVQ